jgi:hypothetical protein
MRVVCRKWSGFLSGSAIPRFAVPTTERPSYGPALAEVAAALGFELMPWQSLVVALEHRAGRLAYRDVAVGTPRQSGKSTLVLSLILYRLLAALGQWVGYGPSPG